MFELRFDDHERSLEIHEGTFAFIGDDTGQKGEGDAIYRQWSTKEMDPCCPTVPLTPEIQAELMKIQAEAERLYERARAILSGVEA